MKQKQDKITPNIGRFSHFQMRRKHSWKLRIRHENMEKKQGKYRKDKKKKEQKENDNRKHKIRNKTCIKKQSLR